MCRYKYKSFGEKVLYCEIMTYIGNFANDSKILGVKFSLR